MNRKILFSIISVVTSILVITSGLVYVFVSQHKYEFPLALNSIDPEDMGVKERLEDFLFMYNVIKDNFPYLELKKRSHNIDWLSLKSYYIKRIKQTESNEEFLEILVESLTALQNLHTGIIPYPAFEYYNEIYSAHNMGAYVEVFSNEIVNNAQFYWYQIMQDLFGDVFDYDVKMVYNKGRYIVVQGDSYNWEEKYSITNGSIVLAVNGTPIDEAVSQSFERSYLYVDPSREKLYVKILTPQLFGNGAIFTIENYTNSAIVNVTFSTIPKLWFYSLPQNNHVTKLSDDCGYIYISSFSDTFVDYDKPMLFSFYEQIENCSKLIIDIRDNSGGSTRYWYENILQPLAKSTLTYDFYLAFRTGDYITYFRENRSLALNMPKDEVPVPLPPEVYTDDFSDLFYAQEQIEPSSTTHFDFDGQIYLLVSDNVYSAAETFAYVCKQTDFATLYGTYTGGDGVGIDPIVFVLPNSKLVIRMSQTMGITADGNADEEAFVCPDYFYESAYGDFNELITYILNE